MAVLRTRKVEAGRVVAGGDAPLLIIAGADTLEREDLVLEIAEELEGIGERLGLRVVYKGSYDKANRSSHTAYRGPGLERGRRMLELVRERTGLPVTTDVHTVEECAAIAEAVDIIQIPAFLCRQNDLLQAAARTGRVVNVKLGQFLPRSSVPLRIAAATGPSTPGVLITERGISFGHGDLVNDLRTFPLVRAFGAPLIFDATHSVQQPGGLGDRSGGRRELIPCLARAAAGAGCDGFFFEVHPEPDRSLCDAPSTLALADLEPLLRDILAIDRVARALPAAPEAGS